MALTANKYVIPNGSPSGDSQPMQSAGVGDAEVNRKAEVGWSQHEDQATQSTPINLNTSEVKLTNDAVTLDLKSSLPNGVTDVWDEVNGQLDLSELSNGDLFHFRLDLTVTTTVANQEVELRVVARAGESVELSQLYREFYRKTPGTFQTIIEGSFFVDNDFGRVLPVEFRMLSDSATGTVKVNKFHFIVTKRVSSY